MSFASTIAELTQQQGRDAAASREAAARFQAQALTSSADAASRAAAAKGAIWGNAIGNIGQSIAQIPAEINKSKILDLQTQDVQAQVEQRQAAAAKVKQQESEDEAIDRAFQESRRPDGTVDLQAFSSKIPGSAAARVLPVVQKVNEAAEADKKNKESTAAHAFFSAYKGGTPASLVTAAKLGSAAGAMTPEDVQQIQQLAGAISSGPPETQEGSTRALAAHLGSHFPQFQDLLDADTAKQGTVAHVAAQTRLANAQADEAANPKPVVVDGALVKPASGEVIYQSAKSKPVDEFQTFKDAYVKRLGKTDWSDLTPVEQMGVTREYAAQKSDPATQRQAAGQAAAVNMEATRERNRRQEVGLKELTDKVETPYLTAKASAAMLRDVVASAKAGNKFSGSMQQAEAALSALRAQGFNRIPAAEFQAAVNAGSLWDNIVGYVGKKAEGQPVPKDIQDDMVKFADILDQAARKKYLDAHKSVKARYGLDEQPLQDEPVATPSTPPSGLTPGLQRLGAR